MNPLIALILLASVAGAAEPGQKMDWTRIPDRMMESIREKKVFSGRYDAWLETVRNLPCRLLQLPYPVGSAKRTSAIREIFSKDPVLKDFSDFQELSLGSAGGLLADSEKDMTRILVNLSTGTVEIYFSPSRAERSRISLGFNAGCVLRSARFVAPDESVTLFSIDSDSGVRISSEQERAAPCVPASGKGFPDLERLASDVGTIVAVWDTGVDDQHPELRDKLTRKANGELLGADFTAGDSLPNDENGHGTFVAGVVAKGAPEVVILPIRMARLRYFGNEVPAVAHALRTRAYQRAEAQINEEQYESIRFAHDHGARVVNISGGGYYPYAIGSTLATEVSPMAGIVRAARDFQDLLVVAAVNNQQTDLEKVGFAPATTGYPNVISVAAVDDQGRLASFSDYGRTVVDLAAHGVQVESLRLVKGRKKDDGGSFAAPQVSRAAGRMITANPALTPVEVKEILCSTARPNPEILNYVRCGILDEDAAIREAIARKKR